VHFIIIFNIFLKYDLDRGMEFEATKVKEFFDEYGIKKYKANSSKIKAAVAERMVKIYVIIQNFLLFR